MGIDSQKRALKSQMTLNQNNAEEQVKTIEYQCQIFENKECAVVYYKFKFFDYKYKQIGMV